MFKTLYSFLFSGKHNSCSRQYCVSRTRTYTSFNTKQHKEKNWQPQYLNRRPIFFFLVFTVSIKNGYIVFSAVLCKHSPLGFSKHADTYHLSSE